MVASRSTIMGPSSSRPRLTNVSLAFCTLGFSSIAFLIPVITFNILDFHILSQPSIHAGRYALAAGVLETLAGVFLTIIWLVTLSSPRRHWLRQLMFWVLCVSLASTAAGLSIFVFVIKKKNGGGKMRKSRGSRVDPWAEIGVWIASAILQAAFYILVFLARPRRDGQPPRLRLCFENRRIAPERPRPPPTPLRVVAPPFALPQTAAPLPPEFLSCTLDSERSSWRDSVHSFEKSIRPINSRARLLTSRASFSRDSTASVASETRSVECVVAPDGVEGHDVGSLEGQLRESVAAMLPYRPTGTTLEPIPGSRPASRSFETSILLGHAPEQDSGTASPTQMPPREEHQDSTTKSPETSDEATASALFIPSAARPGRPSTALSTKSSRNFALVETSSRSASPPCPESHIHPLFRTDSPIPPPLASANTSITASPFSNQIIPIPSRNPSRVSRIGRSGSPALTRSPSLTGPPASIRSRSSSTERGSMIAPPIPGFILSAQRERLI